MHPRTFKEASLGFWEFLEALGEGLVHPEITCLFLKLNVTTQQASHSERGAARLLLDSVARYQLGDPEDPRL